MRWQALAILVILVFGILLPPTLPFMSDHGAMAALVTLDVCHSATPALSSNGDMPFLNSNTIQHLPMAMVPFTDVADSPSMPFIIALQDERPPKH
jgi:hypothetical protein